MKAKAATIWHKMWGVAVLVSVFTSLECKADKNVEFYKTYLITQGEVITFSESYVDNTKTAYLADILEPRRRAVEAVGNYHFVFHYQRTDLTTDAI